MGPMFPTPDKVWVHWSFLAIKGQNESWGEKTLCWQVRDKQGEGGYSQNSKWVTESYNLPDPTAFAKTEGGRKQQQSMFSTLECMDLIALIEIEQAIGKTI